MGKIGWKCVVPNCTSNTKAPGHFFPKQQTIAKKWLDVISVPELNSLSEEEIRKCRICHLHFSPDDYIFSLNRRRLKYDAVPSLNLLQRIENSSDNVQLIENINMTEQQFETQLVENRNITEQHIETQLVENMNMTEQQFETQIRNTPKSSRFTTQVRKQHIDTQINKTPKNSCLSKHIRRRILGSVTRKNLLTPKARQLYTKSLILRKRNIALRSNLVSYKKRLKYATKFSDEIFFKRYQTLTSSQKTFINMQIKNIRKKTKVHFPTFLKNMILTIKQVCGKHASVFLQNLDFLNLQ